MATVQSALGVMTLLLHLGSSAPSKGHQAEACQEQLTTQIDQCLGDFETEWIKTNGGLREVNGSVQHTWVITGQLCQKHSKTLQCLSIRLSVCPPGNEHLQMIADRIGLLRSVMVQRCSRLLKELSTRVESANREIHTSTRTMPVTSDITEGTSSTLNYTNEQWMTSTEQSYQNSKSNDQNSTSNSGINLQEADMTSVTLTPRERSRTAAEAPRRSHITDFKIENCQGSECAETVNAEVADNSASKCHSFTGVLWVLGAYVLIKDWIGS